MMSVGLFTWKEQTSTSRRQCSARVEMDTLRAMVIAVDLLFATMKLNRVGSRQVEINQYIVVDGINTFQTGIVSFGPSPCDESIPAVYTRVAAYREWIEQTVSSNGGW